MKSTVNMLKYIWISINWLFVLKATSWSLKAMAITAVKWKPNFLNEVKLCEMWSNPLPGIYHCWYHVTRYCCGEVYLWLRFSLDQFDSYSFTSFLLSANSISKMSHVLSVVLRGLIKHVHHDPFGIGFHLYLTTFHHEVIKCLFPGGIGSSMYP